jgi:exonuclease III
MHKTGGKQQPQIEGSLIGTAQNPPPPQHQTNPTHINQHIPQHRPTRANLTIATLNVKGRTTLSCGPGPISKWTSINRTMQEKHIGILCVQETHLTDEYVTQINTLFNKCLLVLNSPDPTHSSNSAGVAFVINKELINTESAELTTLIPGQAIHLSITWHGSQKISIVNIYAPNAPSEHPPF